MNTRITGLVVTALFFGSACSAETDKGPEATAKTAAAQLSQPQQKVEIREWQVPYENTRPRDPYVDSRGRVWFCGQAGAYIAYLQPETGEFRKFDIADGAGPHNLIIDDQDFVWFAANTLPYIGKMHPDTGEVQKFPMPGPVIDPHTLVFDSNGDIWFTAQRANHVAKLNTRNGEVLYVAAPVNAARPYGIRMDAKDRPWVVLFGTNKLATIDPATMRMTTFDLPRPGARARRLEITADGSIWYVDYAEGMLGRFDPDNKTFTEWPLPGGVVSRPYGTALDDKATIWIAEGGTPNRLVSFDTQKERFSSITDIPSSKGAVRHMYFHPTTREIWFGEDSNFIGRATVP